MLREIPFAKLLIPFIIGIALYLAFPVGVMPQIFMLIGTIVLALLFIATTIWDKWSLRWVFGLLASLYLVVVGFTLTQAYLGTSTLPSNNQNVFLVKLMEPPEDRGTSVRALARVQSYDQGQGWVGANEKVMLYFSASDSAISKQPYGALLAIQTQLNEPDEPLNPNQFNYRRYLARKQIYQTGYVSPDGWIFLKNQSSSVQNMAFHLREWLLNHYSESGIEGENLAVLSAITLGYKNLLDEETRRVFTASGAMHILAVSGLHVGIIFATLSAFLIFLSRSKKGKLLQTFLLIGFLWFYAFFTGLSPSVVRASLMFSLVLIGNSLNRTNNVYNTLSAAAFIALSFNPLLILDIGFQLSYCAVLSIVVFYSPIYNLLYVKNRYLEKVWALIAVSLAAQIGTSPLSIFHFHQFPNLFLLSNLYAIPLAFLILYLAIGLIIVSPIPFISGLVGWVLNMLLSLLNYLTKLTEAIPHSTTTALQISPLQLLLFSMGIVFLAVFIQNRKSNYLFATLSVFILFFGVNLYTYLDNYRSSELLVFANRSASVISYKHQGKLFVFTSDTLSDGSNQNYSYVLQGYANRHRVKSSKIFIHSMSNSGNDNLQFGQLSVRHNDLGFWILHDNRVVFIPQNGAFTLQDGAERLSLDYLLINAQSPSIEKVLGVVRPGLLIIDQTLPPWRAEKVVSIANQQGISVCNIGKQGALQI